MTLQRARRALFATPLIAVAAVWALASGQAQASTSDEPVAIEAPADLPTDEVVEATTDVPVEELLMVNNCTYYNNASHSQVVGQFGYDCCNNPVSWGRKTKYSVCGGCFPCFPPPQ